MQERRTVNVNQYNFPMMAFFKKSSGEVKVELRSLPLPKINSNKEHK